MYLSIRLKTSFLLFFIILITGQVYSQPPGSVSFNHLTIEDGLSQNSGITILQDSYGYMWFGTLNGLNKYNGYDIHVYRHNPVDSTSISGSQISYLYEDSERNLWIGTTGAGLNLFDRDSDSFIHFKTDYDESNTQNTFSDNAITSIVEDHLGMLWIGTRNGLNRFDRLSHDFHYYFADEDNSASLSSSEITTLYIDSNQTLWIGTPEGLNYLNEDEETFQHYQHDHDDPGSISHNTITAKYEDRQGNFWIGTSHGGLNLFDRENGTFKAYRYDEEVSNSISGDNILSIYEDSNDVLWIGTENEGLNRFDRDEEKFYTYKSNVSNPGSLNHNSIYSMYENNDRILWIGTYSGGISFLDRKPAMFEHYKHEPFDPYPLSNNSVTSFLKTSNGNFLVGTDGGGLNIFDRLTSEFRPFYHDPDDPETLSSNVILDLHEDSQGRIWIGYYNGGITVYNPEDASIKHYRHDPNDPESINNNHIFDIHEGRNGEFWFSTNGGGVLQFDPDTERFVRIGTETPGINVTRDLYHDKNGNLWVGAYGGGLIQLNAEDGTLINQYFEGDNGLSSNVVLSIHEDQHENLWIGTFEGGLHLFDRDHQTFTSYSVFDGLPSPAVLGILEDDSGYLWMSTLNGLSRFDPRTETFINYNTEHGIQSHEFNHLAYYKDSEGYMYFGGVNGFNRFHPDHVLMDSTVAPVVLTDFKIFNESVPIGEESPLKKHISQAEKIIVPYSSSVLTFEFVALNYNANKGDEFAYMLEGFDQNWNYIGQRRSATYTNLNPGEYLFRVKASNRDGIWGETEKSLVLMITPPFWKTTWFYLLILILISGGIMGVLRWREWNILEQNKRLEREVSRQTSELFEKNSKLETALKELRETRSELVEQAHKAGMADLATNVLHNVGNILNSVNISSSLINDVLKNTRLKNLKQANRLLEVHIDDPEDFLLNNPKGKKLLQYYLKMEEPLGREYDELMEQNERLSGNIKLISDVIAAQQSYANAGRISEKLSLEKLVDDTLVLQSASIDRHGMKIVKDYQQVDDVNAERSKMIHTIVNILKNARESMSDLDSEEKIIALKIYQDQNNVYLSVSDNGCGILKEDLGNIFVHGFTTKSTGHGFGLHSCANYMKESGGEIHVESEGRGKGTTVTLSFPRDQSNKLLQPLSQLNGNSNTYPT
jgi:ligand-binding sensor domain-containing protein/signal transduction histidine kinase